ncbi:HET-domain-containing protein, partial [Melanomma pulvis-pyrius CBS 109.77]
MANDFLYTILPSTRSIRLLRLYPGAGSDAIVTSMELIEDYSESPPYYALSYCWGDANDVVGLVCNGKTVQATKNLYNALHHFRQKGQYGLIWCDALCINQRDISERNQQISIMDKIYRRASRVYVWLG